MFSTVRSYPFQPRVSAAYTSAAERESYKQTAVTTPAAPMPSLYEVLGVAASATGQEIKAAYRKLARACHPDVVAVDRKDMSADKFMQIHAAYSTLSDPVKRADYDRTLLVNMSNRRVVYYRSSSFSSSAENSGSSASYSPRSSLFTGFTRRTWETDQCW